MIRTIFRLSRLYMPSYLIAAIFTAAQHKNQKRKNDENMAFSIKTKKVILESGEQVRGVKVTMKNSFNVAEWIRQGSEQAEAIIKIHEGKKDSEYKIRLHTKKGIRVARVGDIVVKLSKNDFAVVKSSDLKK